jgi:energy-coupling factor transport system permease protein
LNLKSKILLGNYIPKDSLIHNIDSRIKLFFLLSFLLTLYFVKTIGVALIFLVIILFGLWIARLPASSILKSLLPFIWLFCLTGLFNLLFTPGELMVRIGPFGITLEGVKMSSLLIIRLTIMILSASLFTLTTSQREIIKAIDWFLKPFRKIGLPISEFSLMVSLSLRFIPILLEEADRIFNAQTSKGANLGGFIKRVKALPLFISPLFTNTFRRAEELTTAMIARGYRP